METKVTGKIIVVGDNIDTDQIYPGRYLDIVDPKEIGRENGIDQLLHIAVERRVGHMRSG